MSRWAEAFSNHAIHTTIQELTDYLNVEPENIETEQVAELRRINKLISLVRDALESADAEVVSVNLLNNLNTQLRHQSFYTQISNFHSNGNAAHVVTANNHFDGHVLPQLQQLLAITNDKREARHEKELTKIFENFVSQAQAERDALEGNHKKQTQEIETLTAKTSELDKNISDLATLQTVQMDTWEASFQEAESIRETSFSDWFDPEKEKVQKTVTDYYSKLKENLDNKLEEAALKHKEILELHGIFAGNSMAAGYLLDGANEGKAANWWRWMSIIFIVATIAWLGFTFYLSHSGNSGSLDMWEKLARTASLTGVLIFGAAYAARQSKSHRDQERKARWFGLEIKGLDPYIASLDEKQQQDLKEKLAERIFGQQQSPMADNSNAHVDNDMLKTILDALMKAVKKQ